MRIETDVKMTDNMKTWFYELISNEIEETLGTASNEHLWALGSDDNETAAMHEEKSEEHRLYGMFLQTFLDAINLEEIN